MADRSVNIVASALAADPARLGEAIAGLEAAGADRVHWDVMDGHFVPNFGFASHVVAAHRPLTNLSFEAHLMVQEPTDLLSAFVDAGCGRLIVHAEACTQLHRVLGYVSELGATAGVAINPATPAAAVSQVLDLVDLVLVMTVNPGFGGQSYLPTMEPKIAEVARLIEAGGRNFEIEVDGGISPSTVGGAVRAGARALVSGTSVFATPGGPAAGVCALRQGAQAALPASV
jgi:ribulose-phosphate 3-epimerase